MKRIILILGCALAIGGIKAQTVTFNYTGSVQTWTVPSCVTSVTVDMAGAQGGSGTGYGGRVQCVYATTPLTVFNIYVGGAGAPDASNAAGGWNGGGNAGTSSGGSYGSGGGGASDIRVGGTALANRVIVAGGGGGINTDNNNPGLGGGLTGGNSNGCCNTCFASWATGGSQVAGGNDAVGSGTCCIFTPTANGSLGVGANGAGPSSSCNNGDGGGGGGGGYYGGGAGGGYGSGAGGSSYTNASCSSVTHTQGYRTGNGYVTLSWTATGSPIIIAGNVINNVSCNGGSNGKASGIVSGGSAPFTYSWAPSGGTHDTASGLTAGTYTITVSDPCGVTSTAAITITQPLTALAATATTTSNVTCNAGSNGATSSTVSGGTTPYTYAWTGGSTNATATGLSAGTYTLNVTDMNGCTATASAVITQPNALAIDTTYATANVLCHGDSTGSAFVMVGSGTMPYTYSWTPGGGTTDSAVGLKAGAYTITVNDACGATATAMVSITEPTALSITSHSTPDNGHNVGTAAISVSGGISPYTYLWTPGGNTTDSISGKAKGTYCCKVTDGNGCIDSICVVIKSTAGIDGIAGNSSQIIVYPNPNNGEFTIESSISGASVVEIYNILGEKVFAKNLSTTKGTNQINVSNQPNGVYLYRVISESGNLLGEGKITLQK